MWIFHVLILVTLINKLVNSEKVVCAVGWFGSACQYKCHCTKKQCGDNGQCVGGSTCKKGWFGPACQYEDLVSRGTVTTNQGTIIPELTDNDISTCLPDIFLQSVSVAWNIPYPVTWIRLHVEDPSLLQKITVQVGQSSSSPLENCPPPYRNFSGAEGVLDIQCQLITEVQQVVLTGEGITSLCSLHISGGRNVALRQSTSQSTTLVSRNVSSCSDNAVDGNTNGNWKHGSCTHTNSEDKSPSWKIRFSRPAIVNRIVLYNRLDTNNSNFPNYYKDHLKGFRLRTSNKYGTEVFSYTDNHQMVQDVYTITSATALQPILEVQIQSKTPYKLSLCEVEIYGDTDCEPGHYGRECEHTCNCAIKNEACFVSTGGCLSGCAPGFRREGCIEPCGVGQHGRDCKVKCSQFCKVKSGSNVSSCHHVDGKCLYGCQIGYKEPLCLSPCQKLTFGENCRKTCGQACGEDGSCHHITGECSHGCKDGYTGDTCTEKCVSDTYGKNCNSSCSPSCIKDDDDPKMSPCHHVNGNCLYGCKSGHEGLHCGLAQHPKEYSSLSSEIIAGIAVGAAVFVCITAVLIWAVLHKHRKIRRLRIGSQNSPDYDNAPGQRQHDYEPVYSEADDGFPKKDFSSEDAPSDRKDSINENNAHYTDKDHYDYIKYDLTEPKGD